MASAAAVLAPPAAVAERRVTSVLFGDLVGFTALSESRDAEDVRELLSGYFAVARTVVGRYGGTIEKFIGDAVMAVWGVPVALEDDAERAVRAGLDLVAAVAAMGADVGAPGLAMRVGVVTGEVAVTLGATAEGMVAGDAVNTAARVQAAAAPGSVWVDEATRSLTAAAVDYADVGLHAMKGKAAPVRLFQARVVVAAVGGAQRIDGLEAPFTGRDRQLRLVKELCHETAEEGRPRLVLVAGGAGVGKSRLAWEFFKYIDGLSSVFAWHQGRCLSYGEGAAFWAIAEAVRSRLGLSDADPSSVVQERLVARLPEFLPEVAEREWVAPRLGVLLGVSGERSYAREDLFAAWTRFLERAGAGDPVIVVLEDVHHADDALLDFLDHLLATATSAVHVLALARPELLERRPALISHRRVTVLHLEPLNAEAMGTLVDGLVEGLTAQARAALVERADGIPLFAVETVRALIDRDLVVPREGRYVLGPDTAAVDVVTLGAPASLHALVASRLDALPAGERRLLSSASILGLSFPLSGLQAVHHGSELDVHLAGLVRRELLAVQADRFAADHGQLRFVQAVVRQVAYNTLSRRDRRAGHLAAAAYLQREANAEDLAALIAQHLLDAVAASSAGDTDREELNGRAVLLLQAAAERALQMGAGHESLRHLSVALDSCTEEQTVLVLHERAALAARDAGAYEACLAHTGFVLTALGDTDPTRSALTAAIAGTALRFTGRTSEAIALLQPVLAALPDTEAAQQATLTVLHALHGLLTVAGDHVGAAVHADRQLGLAERIGDPAHLTLALMASGLDDLASGRPVAAMALLRGAADLARTAGLPNQLVRALSNLCACQVNRDLQQALSAGQEALEHATRAPADMRGVAGVNLALCKHLSGAWTDLARLDSPAAVDLDELAWGEDTLLVLQLWQELAVTGHVTLAAVPSGWADDVQARAWLEQATIVLAQQQGDLHGAAAAGAHSLDAALQASGLDDDFPLLWPPAALASIQAGLFEQAQQQIELVSQAPGGLVTALLLAQLPRLEGMLLAARGGDPVELLTRGADALDRFGAVPDAARTRHALAAWLVEHHRPAEALPLIESTQTTYTNLGAQAWLDDLASLQRTAVPA